MEIYRVILKNGYKTAWGFNRRVAERLAKKLGGIVETKECGK